MHCFSGLQIHCPGTLRAAWKRDEDLGGDFDQKSRLPPNILTLGQDLDSKTPSLVAPFLLVDIGALPNPDVLLLKQNISRRKPKSCTGWVKYAPLHAEEVLHGSNIE